MTKRHSPCWLILRKKPERVTRRDMNIDNSWNPNNLLHVESTEGPAITVDYRTVLMAIGDMKKGKTPRLWVLRLKCSRHLETLTVNSLPA
ncbi:hypothetical protein Ahia01_001149200 [Argonauta hians]